MDPRQLGAYSKDEIALFKLFIDSREDAALILRNHLLQLEVTAEERHWLRSLSPETRKAIKRVLLPELTREVPLTQEATMHARLTFIEQFSVEGAYFHIQANDLIIEYFKQQIHLLEEDGEPSIILQSLPLPPESRATTLEEETLRVRNMIAYNKIIPLAEERVYKIQLMANPPAEESPEEQAKRAKMNSNK